MNDQNWVAAQRQSGKNDQEIKAQLKDNGWTDAQITDALAARSEAVPPPPTADRVPASVSEEAPTGFNWGAFWLTWIWGVGHGLWLTLLLIPLAIVMSLFTLLASIASLFSGLLKDLFGTASVNYSWIAFGVVVILNVVIGVWFGRKGNEWAWSRRGTRDEAAAHKREQVWAVVGWIFGVLVLLSWVTFAASLIAASRSSATLNCSAGVTVTVNGVNKCSASSASTKTTAYAGTDFSFNYNAAWQTKRMSQLLETGQTDISGDPVLFLTAAQLTAANQAITNFKNDPNADLGSFFTLLTTFKSEVVVTYTASADPAVCSQGVSILDSNGQDECAPGYKPATDPAQAAADQLTQTVCTGTTSNYDSSNPVVSSLVSTVTVAGKTGYAVVSDPACANGTYNILVDNSSGVIDLDFGAKNRAALSADQQTVLNSLKVQ